MISRSIFILAHQANDINFYSYYKFLRQNQWRLREDLEMDQIKRLKNMIRFAYDNVPYYHRTFKEIDLNPEDINSLRDIQKIPVLTKDIIRNNYEDLKPANIKKMHYLTRGTGGSTGTPLQYRLDKKERFFMAAMLYRGWGYGGYELGDRTLFFGGSSLGVSTRSNMIKKLNESIRNIRMVSSFDMNDTNLNSYINIINNFHPKFIYGYASSLNFFASYLKNNDFHINKPISIFTTAEKLYPHMRKNIGEAFDAAVFDTYGLNDSGATAFECDAHQGLHIDTERAFVEIVDENNNPVNEGYGRILATSLNNQSMPFIRYETQDIGNIDCNECACGRKYSLMKEIIGRSQEILITPEGTHVHGEFFTHIFWEINGVKEFQVRQIRNDTLVIELVVEELFNHDQLNTIEKYIQNKSSKWKVNFIFSDYIDRTRSGKYRFVINEVIDEW